MKTTALIVAGGSGTRMGIGQNKVFCNIGRKTVMEVVTDSFFLSDCVDEVVIVTRKEDLARCRELVGNPPKPVMIVEGGGTRQQSVKNGLDSARGDIVIIHDAARPLVTEEMIRESVSDCEKYGAAAVGMPCVDTLKLSDGEFITGTVDRERIVCCQTPQTFFLKDIKRAHEMAERDGYAATDDCSIYEKYIGKIKLVKGSRENVKITYAGDLELVREFLKGNGRKV